jgi:hypothetical protein
MSIEAIAAAAMPQQMPVQNVDAGYGAGISDVNSFQGAMRNAGAGNVGTVDAVTGPPEISPAMKTVFNQLEKVNGEAKSVSDFAKVSEAKAGGMTPGEIVQLTVRCQEFMFHCQLTSNIANRTSDGIQQLFRQQS